LHTIISDDARDDCDCPFCVGGCFPLKILLNELIDTTENQIKAGASDDQKLSATLHSIDSTLETGDESRFYKTMAGRALRYLTFCEFDITHTCCSNSPFAHEEIQEIHEEEADLITQLDELVEEFTRGYGESSLSFHEFLREVWRPRMDEILSEKPSEHDIIELRRVGVTVRDEGCDASWRSLLT
jgi:hypothetical protein